MALADDLANLKAARAKGEKRITYNGKTVEYRDMVEIEQAIAAIEAEISAETSPKPARSSLAYHYRGY